MRPSSTSRRYAQAAYDVAAHHGHIEQWIAQLRSARQVMQDTEVGEFFRDPKVGMHEKLRALDTSFDSFDPQVLNLLRILVSRHRASMVGTIADEFEALDRKAKNIAEAEVTVARSLSPEEIQDVTSRLSAATGKTIQISTKVDLAILGGVIVRIGDRLIDASVSGRLQRLRERMTV